MSKPAIEIRRHEAKNPWTYRLLDLRQREIATRVREGGAGAILLSELAPVITVGRRTAPGDFKLDQTALAMRGVEVVEVDRGGLATYHGPGQWVLFAVDSLERLTGDRRGVRIAVEGLLGLAHEVARRVEPQAEIRGGLETGVWGPRGKLASIGIHIDQGILLHGLALNGFATDTSFLGIRPCGLDALPEFLANSEDQELFVRLGQELVQGAQERFWDLKRDT